MREVYQTYTGKKFSFVKVGGGSFFLVGPDRMVGFNLKWWMGFCQAPWISLHCSLSGRKPGKLGRRSVAHSHSPGTKLTGGSSARYKSMALSLLCWHFKGLHQKLYVWGHKPKILFPVSSQTVNHLLEC